MLRPYLQPGLNPKGQSLAVRRQQNCEEQQDVLRPYSSLAYAWDEPSQPHRLVLALPGNRKLGAFDLDKVRAGLPTGTGHANKLPQAPSRP